MRSLFLDRERHLRNGWWVVVFVLSFLIVRQLVILGTRTLESHGVPRLDREPLSLLIALLATWACTRLRREPLASVGLRLDRRWLIQVGAGTAIGAGQIVVVVAALVALGGVSLELNPGRSAGALVSG